MKKPYWIRRTHLLRADEYLCSRCGKKADRPTAYCPACGVRMAGTKKDAHWILEAEILDDILGDDF